jgi:hypothetical protein
MGFLKKLKDILLGTKSGKPRDPDGIYFHVQCEKCGAPLRIRADKRHDLQRDYDTGEYVLHKEMMDNSCFNLMQATIRFDASYNIVDREIDGGKFITKEEFEAHQPTSDSDDATEADDASSQPQETPS